MARFLTDVPLGALENNLPDGAVFRLIRRADGAYRFLHLSAGVEALAGVRPADALDDADAFFRRVLAEDRSRLWVLLERSASDGSPINQDVRVWGAGGVVRWAELRTTPRPLPDGGIVWDGFLLDDTDRKRAELLVTTEARVSALLAEHPRESALWPALLPVLGEHMLWDVAECWRVAKDGGGLGRTAAWCRPETRLERFADASREWRFPDGEGLPGLAWHAGEPVWMPDLAGSPFFRRQELAAEAGLGCAVGVPVRVGGGCVGVVALFGRPVGQDYPAMRAFLGSLGRTLSRYLAHHRAERAVRRARDAAERANRAKDRFLANVSHELRTPLTGILGTVGLALNDAPGQAARDRLEAIRDCGESLLGIVNDLLDLAKVQAGKLELRPAPFNLRAELAKGLRTLSDRAEAKGVRFTLGVADGVPAWVVGDAARLRQVMVNLVGNAVKFTSEGKVSVSVSVPVKRAKKPSEPVPCPAMDCNPSVHTGTDTDTLHFSVKDTGIGIPPDKLAAVFRPFEQADGSTSRKYGGTGLGLAISNELVRDMGGRLRAKSTPGAGTTFSFTLPLPAADAPSPAETAPIPAPVRSLDILLAEDTPIVRQVTAELLTRAGHRVTEVADGAAAVAACEAGRFDVVLMDLHMPVLGGLEAAATIRAADAAAGRRTPIVAFTAGATTGSMAACRGAGLDGFVGKPIDTPTLLAVLAATTSTQVHPPPKEEGSGCEAPPAGNLPPSMNQSDKRGTNQGCTAAVLDSADEILARVGHHRELLTQLMPRIASDAGRVVAEARAAADRGDWAGVAAGAHKLGGLVGLLSTRGCEAARLLEAAAAARDALRTEGRLSEAEGLVAAMPGAVREMLAVM